VILYNNIGLNSKASEDMDTESTEKLPFLTAQCRLMPHLQTTFVNIHINFVLPDHGIHSAHWQYTFIFISFYAVVFFEIHTKYSRHTCAKTNLM